MKRFLKPLPPRWYAGLDLRSRPRFRPALAPLSLTKLMRNRRASQQNMRRRG